MSVYVHGLFNATKCAKYLRGIGVEITDEQAASWIDCEKADRFLRKMKRTARQGWDWWCNNGHHWFCETRRGQRAKRKSQADCCPTCGGYWAHGGRRFDVTIDGAVRDYRASADRWKPLDSPDEPSPR